MKINWKKTISSGIIIWAVAFIVASALIAIGVKNVFLQWLIIQVAVVITGYKFVKKLSFNTKTIAIVTGLVWVAVMLVLDLVVTRYFTTMSYFYDWKSWVSYVIILFLPVITIYKTEPKPETPITPPPAI